ncbi:hypothetical protein LX36DRAFT_659358, partial [Colletotrichum falcatum]
MAIQQAAFAKAAAKTVCSQETTKDTKSRSSIFYLVTYLPATSTSVPVYYYV